MPEAQPQPRNIKSISEAGRKNTSAAYGLGPETLSPAASPPSPASPEAAPVSPIFGPPVPPGLDLSAGVAPSRGPSGPGEGGLGEVVDSPPTPGQRAAGRVQFFDGVEPPDIAPTATEVAAGGIQRSRFSRRGFLWGSLVAGVAAIGGIAYVSKKEQAPPLSTSVAKSTSAPTGNPTLSPELPRVVASPEPRATATVPTPIEALPATPAQPTRVPGPLGAPRLLTPEPNLIPDLLVSEREAWRKILGVEVEVKPLPASITPEVRRNLESFGLKLMYLPRLELGTLDDLKRLGESGYLDELQKRYPNWKHYERMNSADGPNFKMPRNLSERYWSSVKGGYSNFPNLPGQWLAIEKLSKPANGAKYERTTLGERLGFKNRFDIYVTDARESIEREKASILIGLGFKDRANIRMLEALEWNLAANREGWGETNSYEWTNTEEPVSGGGYRPIFVGSSDHGGAANISHTSPGMVKDMGGDIGFRVVVVFDPESTKQPSPSPTRNPRA